MATRCNIAASQQRLRSFLVYFSFLFRSIGFLWYWTRLELLGYFHGMGRVDILSELRRRIWLERFTSGIMVMMEKISL